MMSCSEAIRLGAMLKPQSYGAMSGRHRTHTCALEAALDAVGSRLPWSRAFLLWPVLQCPVRLGTDPPSRTGARREHVVVVGRATQARALLDEAYFQRDRARPSSFVLPLEPAVLSLDSVVVKLNDRYHWTREEIADVVERVEQGQVTQTGVHAEEPEHQLTAP